MRLENINWDSAFYFNSRGKTRKARRQVPLSERVVALLRNIQQEQLGQKREGWVFPSKKSRSGHIGLSGLEHMFRKIAGKLGIPDALKLYCARHTFGTVAVQRRGILDWSRKSWGTRAWIRRWAICIPRRLRSKW